MGPEPVGFDLNSATVRAVARVQSVNIAAPGHLGGIGLTGIDKRPVSGPVEVCQPGPKGTGGSGLIGDAICNLKHHGGNDQAVYAYAREDLDSWEALLGRPLPCGTFGENLTTVDVGVSSALIGERWQIGEQCILEVTIPRVPCRTFALWLGEKGWVNRFKAYGAPGAYLRVITPGATQAGDTVQIVHRPTHDVTMAIAFEALTGRPELLPRLLAAGDALPEHERRRALRTLNSSPATPK